MIRDDPVAMNCLQWHHVKVRPDGTRLGFDAVTGQYWPLPPVSEVALRGVLGPHFADVQQRLSTIPHIDDETTPFDSFDAITPEADYLPPQDSEFGDGVPEGASRDGADLADGDLDSGGDILPGNSVQLAQNPTEPPRNRNAGNPTGQQPRPSKPQAFDIILPKSGKTIDDPSSATGYLMGPKSDLSEVAAAGLEAGKKLLTLRFNDFINDLRRHLGHGGKFDYQRRSDGKGGWIPVDEFVNVSSFNVGLFCQQAGLSLNHTFWIAGQYASLFSKNAEPADPTRSQVWEGSQFLPPHAKQYIAEGWRAGKRAEFYRSPNR